MFYIVMKAVKKKWLIAPIIGVLVAVLFFGIHSSLANGIVMSGIVPSGTSANLNSLIGGGDVAYSVTMSAVDTFIGPILTPLLAKLFVGTGVHIAYFPFVWKMLRIVFLPLLTGIIIQSIFPLARIFLKSFAPILSSLALYGIVLGVVSDASDVLYRNSGILLLVGIAVIFQVGAQMVIGFLYGKALRIDKSSCRSLVFEIGICNSALAAVLSNDVFGPLAAVAAILNMVCNLTLGGFVASYMKRTANSRHEGYENSSTVTEVEIS
ncbi:bile acid:sodium symporter [Fodinisporobacter ferrooxydans]|uniref:Bile acid:sodium symporter n=1 Tax=Fodinisporobacter ferrooxydans TaxID=2901836 RepID=A0ABY4CI66_9BACL|nr:bile acid:sodium symporter [Alicyclobacillaceae bacterium MYW30-H2]